MTQYLIVGIGGALGSVVRYSLGRMLSKRSGTAFPIGTFIINVSGAFLLGIVSTIKLHGNTYVLLADGFLGAYTTFSTFMYEGYNLFQKNEKINAYIYILGSFVIGIVGFVLGVLSAKIFVNV